MSKSDFFNAVSPLDFRYYSKELQPYFSENARIHYQAQVELAAVKALHKLKVCPAETVKQVEKAVKKVKAKDVYAEEKRIKHDIRALANIIRDHCTKKNKKFVHLGLTSNDVVNTAEILRYRDAVQKVILPELIALEKQLIKMALTEKATVQIGRTHGQHAVPITFGFTLASYIDRLGQRIEGIHAANKNLVGKIAGAVGAYNATSLLVKNPAKFEALTLANLKLKPARHSTQVLQPESLLILTNEIMMAFGVMANLSDDFRNLQRTEIAELFEEFEKKQVGSSTMPHKRNPINFENVKSFWKVFMPRMQTLYMDQISEHQRDLTNSASLRFAQEILIGFHLSQSRLRKTLIRLKADRKRMRANVVLHESQIVAEPLYILLSKYGHPDAHEAVRKLSIKAEKQAKPLFELILVDTGLEPYLRQFTGKERGLISFPETYTGKATQKTIQVCQFWKNKLKGLSK